MSAQNRFLRTTSIVAAAVLVLALALIGVQVLQAGSSTQPPGIGIPAAQGIYRGLAPVAKFDISPPLRDIAPAPFDAGAARELANDLPTGLEGKLGPQDTDNIVQRTIGPLLIPTPIVSFDGQPNLCNCSPPDPNGDVGPNHYVAMANLHFQIFNKTGGSLYGPVPNNTLWSGFGGACQQQNAGDPVVIYDQLADRWLMTQFTSSPAPDYYNCVALSTSPDPTGTWYRWAFSTGANFPDYPKWSMWPDAYYASTREFAGPFVGVGAYAGNRAQMIAGNPSPQVVSFLVPPGGQPYNVGDGLLPADLDGTALPPPNSPNYWVGSMDNGGPYGAPQDALTLWKFTVDWPNPPNSTFVLANTLPIAAYDTIFPCSPTSRNCIPQPGTTNKVDILSYRQRPMFRLAYRNFGTHESLVTNQSVEAVANMAGIRWWELRSPNASPVIFQEGTYAPGAQDGIHRWMGSIAQDRQGNMALGYSVSDPTSVYPGVRYTGRLVSDPPGQMPQGEAAIHNGTGSQTSSGRWGDYTSMSIDPVDDCTFWHANQYIPTTSGNGWRLRIGAFKFTGCVAGTPTPTVTGTPPTATSTPPATATNTPGAATPTPTATSACAPAWNPGPSTTQGRYAFQGALAGDGNLYVAGGQTSANIPLDIVERYNQGTNTWTAMANLPDQLGQVSVGAEGNKVYVAGGWPGGSVVEDSLYIYDIPTNSWTTGPNMPAGTEAAAGVVLGGKFYVIGGDDFNVALTSVYVYDIATNSWSTTTSLPAARTNTYATAAGGMIYLGGGLDQSLTNAVDNLLRFDPVAATWTDLGSAGTGGRGNYGAISTYGTGQLLITAGGTGGYVASDITRFFTIATGTFSPGPNLLTPHLGHAQGTLADGRVLVYSGLGASGANLTTELLSAPCVTPTATPTVAVPTATSTQGPTATATPGGPTATATAAPSWQLYLPAIFLNADTP